MPTDPNSLVGPRYKGTMTSDVVLLDGGFATELERRGHDLSDDLWSARLLRDDPDEVIATHLAFYRAGADVATTASYQASVGTASRPPRQSRCCATACGSPGSPPRWRRRRTAYDGWSPPR
jgi:S-methylmethionine-dependent homocysteine/selenocysteine methylase